jgi:MFS family permease
VATGHALTYGGFLLLGGRAADLYRRRRVFLGGLVLFGVMSLAAGLAPNVGLLVAARGVQGIGAALTVPAAVSIIATTFPEGMQRNRTLGVFAASGSAGFSGASCWAACSPTCWAGPGFPGQGADRGAGAARRGADADGGPTASGRPTRDRPDPAP